MGHAVEREQVVVVGADLVRHEGAAGDLNGRAGEMVAVDVGDGRRGGQEIDGRALLHRMGGGAAQRPDGCQRVERHAADIGGGVA